MVKVYTSEVLHFTGQPGQQDAPATLLARIRWQNRCFAWPALAQQVLNRRLLEIWVSNGFRQHVLKQTDKCLCVGAAKVEVSKTMSRI